MFSAKIKSVLSGDTVILTPVSNQTTERQLSLAFVSAPRLNSDEPYGFESREYLRTLLVGKQIQFKVIYTANDREYGDVAAPVFNSLIEKCLSAGTVKLRDDVNNREAYTEELATKFQAAQDQAQNAKVGVWAEKIPTIESLATLPSTVTLNNESPQYKAIVERVISGDRLQVRALLSDAQHYVGPVLVAGIRSPRSTSKDAPAEPFGDAAKAFVSARLLQRSVQVQFLQKSSTGVPIAVVSHPVGDISVFLLKAGLATVADWQSQYLGAQKMSALRAAQNESKNQKLNLWKDSVGGGSTANGKSYDAIIAKVVSPDTYVLSLSDGSEKTVQLASLRSPRKSDPSQEVFVPLAKEFSRSHFIGKKVKATLVAIRPKSEQFDERELVTIALQNNGQDIATTLVESGYASVVKHRKDDEDRSPIWDELIEKENEAIAKHKGMYSKKPPAPDRTVDASETLVKAKGFLTSLQRQSRIPGVVDYIPSGGRFRIHVPRENCTLSLVLAGIRVPRTNEEFGEDALKFVSSKLWQRDVSFSVNDVDKTGAFIGNLYMPGSNQPLSVILASNGFAEVNEYSAQKSGFYDELLEAEEEAKAGKKGIWKDYEPETAAPVAPEKTNVTATNGTSSNSAAKNYIDVVLSDVSDTGLLSYRTKASEASYHKIKADLAAYNNAAANSASFAFKTHPKKGQLVTAVIDKSYFRAKIVSYEKDTARILLIDTGRELTTSFSNLRQLPAQFTSMSPCAIHAELSFVQIPSFKEYVEEYVAYFKDKSLLGKTLVANVDSTSPVHSLTLYTADSKGPNDSINQNLIYNGYAFIRQKLPQWAKTAPWADALSSLTAAEKDARDEHIGIWEYGDPRDDDEY